MKATGIFVILLSQDGWESDCPKTKFQTISRIYWEDKSNTPPPLMFSWGIYEFFRSSYRRCFMKKAVLKIHNICFAIFTGKLQACNFIKNRPQRRHFPLNIVKILRTPISKNIADNWFWFFKTALKNYVINNSIKNSVK